MGILPLTIIWIYGLAAAVPILVLALAVFGLILALERPRRMVWLVAPAIVLSTFGLALSGLPRLARFKLAEPALTTYAAELLDQTRLERGERGRATVGGLRVRRTIIRDGCVHLVTASVGILGDVPAGLAFCPAGPIGTRYELLSGAWYRW
jgi:hypothetical protein